MLTMTLANCGYEVYSVKGANVVPDAGHVVVRRCSLLFEARVQIWSDFDGVVLPDVGASALVSSAIEGLLTGEYEHRFGSLHRVRKSFAALGLFDEYMALYRLVADQATLRAGSSDPRWQYRQGRTDLGLGPGVREVAGATLCKTAIVLNGFQLPAAGGDVFPGAPAGRAVLTLGLFDLESGEIIGVNRIVLPAGRDLRQAENRQLAIARLLKEFSL